MFRRTANAGSRSTLRTLRRPRRPCISATERNAAPARLSFLIDASRVSRCLSTASALCSSRYASRSRHCFNKRIALRPTFCFMQQGASRSYSQHSLTQHRLHCSQYRSSLRGSARGPWSFRSFLFRCATHDCGTTGDPLRLSRASRRSPLLLRCRRHPLPLLLFSSRLPQ